MPQFSHLHNHTQFSLLDGANNIKKMFAKAERDNMPAVAITDHGNMFGAFKFVAEASKFNVKPIIGCEFYMVDDRHKKSFTREERDRRYHQLMLAKNEVGYRNLSKLCSLGYMEGLYSKWPRIDKELVEKYHEGIIATTCCLGAEIPQAILHKSEEEAEELFKWWLNLFGEDFYVELQRHQIDEQIKVNLVLQKFAKKHNVKMIASNDSHYLEQEDYDAHDVLLCVNTGENKSKPVWKGDGFGGKDYRFGFPNDQFYFKDTNEMGRLFADLQESLDNTNEIVDKINTPQLKRDIMLPNFPIPPEYLDAADFLKHLSFEGAKKRYHEITSEIEERINHELHIIKTMGFDGYFLITADLINEGKNRGVMIGPGRGSAAGSVVAYCVGITNIDPIKYSLLFERFLNPERVSMPDIDTDFDDVGRQKVIDYVVEKYGKNQVAHIITYGSMAAKMAIRDVSRVLELPLSEADHIAKLIPERPGISLDQAFDEVPELAELYKSQDIKGEVLRMAHKLEGSVRNSGIHAAGIIIAPDDLTDYIPVCTQKDTDLLITQFDGKVIEDAGMLKMDFLGLKTLTIIKDALVMIKKNHGVDIDIDHISLEDPKTFELYQRGDTIGTFQFESTGMRKHLQALKPTDIEDLIAMNALYRPGPMGFIPNFIDRKQGREEAEYPHELLKPILSNTFGIMVYQEQIMQTAQILAGYSLGQADLLRRAMGKKKMSEMDKQREIFIKGAEELHGIDAKKSNEIFDVMAKFAEYGFNRSHSAAYSVVAYQTAFLKANYPSEYMASVLSHNQNNIEKITFFMDECRRQDIAVLGPHVNESGYSFEVNKNGEIRFGMGAIKGTGEAAIMAIISERDENGHFEDVFDFAGRVNLRTVNKKTFEALAMGGGFDCFENMHRRHYLVPYQEGEAPLIETIIRYGNSVQAERNSNQVSLFGGDDNVSVMAPRIPVMEPFGDLEKLRLEKDVVGFYISGHPLDHYKLELDNFCTCKVADFEKYPNQDISLGGMITSTREFTSKKGNLFGRFVLEDFDGHTEVVMFGEDYMRCRHMLVAGTFVHVRGRVQEKWGQIGMLEFKPTVMTQLSEVRNTLTDAVIVDIPALKVDEKMIYELETIVQEYPGKCALRVRLYDESEERILINFMSRRFRIDPCNEALKIIAHHPDMSYTIKRK